MGWLSWARGLLTAPLVLITAPLVLIIKTFESLKFYGRPHDNDNLTKDALQVIQLIEIFLMSTSLEMMSQQPFQIF